MLCNIVAYRCAGHPVCRLRLMTERSSCLPYRQAALLVSPVAPGTEFACGKWRGPCAKRSRELNVTTVESDFEAGESVRIKRIRSVITGVPEIRMFRIAREPLTGA